MAAGGDRSRPGTRLPRRRLDHAAGRRAEPRGQPDCPGRLRDPAQGARTVRGERVAGPGAHLQPDGPPAQRRLPDARGEGLAADLRAPGRQPGAGPRQQTEVRVPGQRVARAAHASLGDHRLLPDPARWHRWAGQRGPAPGHPAGQQERPIVAGVDQPDPRPEQNRGRQDGPFARARRAARPGHLGVGEHQPARPGERVARRHPFWSGVTGGRG